jgi:hypothetical protein
MSGIQPHEDGAVIGLAIRGKEGLPQDGISVLSIIVFGSDAAVETQDHYARFREVSKEWLWQEPKVEGAVLVGTEIVVPDVTAP